jgi:hypothetical protein
VVNPDVLQSGEEGGYDAEDLDETSGQGLIGMIIERRNEAEDGKETEEVRWLLAYKNYRGIYDTTTQFREKERSKVFIKITKVKVLAAYGQILEVLFANNRIPIEVAATDDPHGIAKYAHLSKEPQEPVDPIGYAGDGRDLPPGALEATKPHFLGGLEKQYEGANIKEGPARAGEPQISPAALSAEHMQRIIRDQLLYNRSVMSLRQVAFEMCLLGTGVMKGPYNTFKTIHKWAGEGENRQYTPEEKLVPEISSVSCWDFYPDPAARNIDEAEWVIQRHRMNRSELRGLRKLPYFRGEAIDRCLEFGPNYEKRDYEDSLYNLEDNTQEQDFERFDVYEYWGIVDKETAQKAGIELDEIQEYEDEVQINAWVCGPEILRAVINPFTPARIPYQVVPYEENPYQFFGVGVAENMEDAQMLMNGHIRMSVDNLALAGNLVFDVDESMLVAGQSYEVWPGKVFRRQSGQPGQAIHGIKFPNTAPENLQMYDKARQLADEETGIPSVMHGQTGVTGTGRTASGLSMLMNAGSVNIKTVIKNVDEYLLKTLGESYFQWNMQFNTDAPEIVGDLEIKASGTAALMQKEVRSQRLTTLLQVTSNPTLAPFIKIPNLMRELAISMDVDPESMVNNMDDAAIFAEILKGMQAQNEQATGPQAANPNEQPRGPGGVGGVPPGANPADSNGTGGGTIGTGSVPGAGEAGFTGNS